MNVPFTKLFLADVYYCAREQTTCTDRLGLNIDNGRVNPPSQGPARKIGPGVPYDVWCDDGKSPLDKNGVKDGKGCREMRFMKAYDSSCASPN